MHHSVAHKSSADTSVDTGKENAKSNPKTSNSNKAQRIRFLERIDQDYYKMLKKTLELEKAYTRDNHKFTRTFKRDKYVKRDNIYREKQFESTFSVLWSSKQNAAGLQKSKSVRSLYNTDTPSLFKAVPLNKSIKMKLNGLFDRE